ncbi:potassium channel family protein, partial [Cellulomonas shaoxiangyii]
MGTIWWVLGVLVLAATLLDVFLTALNYDESGYLAGRLARLQWRALRSVTRRLPRRRRPLALRQVTGLQIVSIVLMWLFGTILGYGLVYYGLMTSTAFSVSGTGASLDLFSALYFSAAQLATVGGSSLTAETDVLRFLSIAESLTGVVLISLILTFLLGVYSVIADLNALCTRFVTAERGAGSPVATLRPYLRDGEPVGLDGHLDAVADAFSSYTDGVRLNHAAYYFQSGRDRFALPYALRMIGGTLAALRWGLPSGHPASTLPTLETLTFQYLEFGQYLQDTAGWSTSLATPDPVDPARFARLARGTARAGERDAWVARFLQTEHQLAPLAGADPLADLDDAYRRYTRWLPFAHRAEEITLGVGRDLDYQPVIVSDVPVSLLDDADPVALGNVEGYLTDPSPAAGDARATHPAGLARRWLEEHVSLSDPGYARLRSAARALLTAVAAGLTTYVVVRATGAAPDDLLRPAIFGGFVGMLASGAVSGPTAPARARAALVTLAPVVAVVVLAAYAGRSHVWTGVLAVAVAAAGAWSGRFGARWARLGTAVFMACYFALLMRMQVADVVLYLAGAVLGVAWAYLFVAVVLPDRPDRVLHAGLAAFRREVASSLDVLVDAVSRGSWDAGVRRRVAVDQRRLNRGSAFLAGRLGGGEQPSGVDPREAGELRLHLFSAHLAEVHLVTAARALTGTTVSLELRGRLAGTVERLRVAVAQGDAVTWRAEPTPDEWPQAARAVHRATSELAAALAALDRVGSDAGSDPASGGVAGGTGAAVEAGDA